MPNREHLIRDVSDTARWAAWCRSAEGDRPDALFLDPLARRLAGERGQAIEESMSKARGSTVNSLVVRTVAFDRLVMERIAAGGIDTVVNLAAGLDSRPYRLALPADLRWVEVDLPPLVAYKDAALADETAACRVERIGLDLSQTDARLALLASIGERSTGALVMTEGLLLYLDDALVSGLARDLAAVPAFRTWLADVLHPALLPIVVRSWQASDAGGEPPRFAPEGGTAYFRRFGWAERGAISAYELGESLGRPVTPTEPATDAHREAFRIMNTYVRLDKE